MRCDVCGLVDPYNGQGDGIGSCGCPRCEGGCGVADGSSLCICPDFDEFDETDPWDDGYWDAKVDAEGSNEPIEHEVVSVRPGETPRKITTRHLPGADDARS